MLELERSAHSLDRQSTGSDFHQRVLDKQSTGRGDTAIILACCHGHDSVAQLLRSAGVRADIATRNGWRYEDSAKWYLRKAKHEDSPDK